MYVFHQILAVWGHYFLKNIFFFCLSIFSVFSDIQITHYTGPSGSIYIFSIFFFLCCSDFIISIDLPSSSLAFFSVLPILATYPSSNLFLLDTVYFFSKLSIWFLFIVSISLRIDIFIHFRCVFLYPIKHGYK